jgi:UPF0755 protein
MKKRILKRISYIAAVLVLLLIIAGAGAVIWYQSSISAIYDVKCTTKECESQKFTVVSGEGAAQIADKLEQAGLIKSAFAFRIYLTLNPDKRNLLPGEYYFSKNMSVEQIVKSLNTGIVARTVTITFLPGETVRAARKKLIDAGFDEAEVDEALGKQYNHELLKSKPADASLEGYIWGDTYEFYADAKVEDILKILFDQMLKVVNEEGLVAKYQARGLTLHQGITLASVVQRESTADYEEQRHVAQVFLTRYARGMALGSDAIIAYRADQLNPYRNKKDMSYLSTIDCPWDSRHCAGLPPTPISSPGRNALKSVADPTDTQDLYFLTGDDGKMYYAKTEAEHNANKVHCPNLCQYL